MTLKSTISWEDVQQWAAGTSSSPFPEEWHNASVPNGSSGTVISDAGISMHEVINPGKPSASLPDLFRLLAIRFGSPEFVPGGNFLRHAPNGLGEYEIRSAWFQPEIPQMGAEFELRRDVQPLPRKGSIEERCRSLAASYADFPPWPVLEGDEEGPDPDWWSGGLDAVWKKKGLAEPRIANLMKDIGRDCFVFEESDHPPVDLHCTCYSGIHGPIPMTKALEWPDCPECEIPLFVNPSYDFAGLPFAGLLPGRTLACFLCPDCIRYGNWESGGIQFRWFHVSDVLIPRVRPGSDPFEVLRAWIPRQHREFPQGEDLVYSIRHFADAYEALRWQGVPWPVACKNRKAGGYAHWLQNPQIPVDAKGLPMEFIALHHAPDEAHFYGFIFVFHSVVTGETCAVLDDT